MYMVWCILYVCTCVFIFVRNKHIYKCIKLLVTVDTVYCTVCQYVHICIERDLIRTYVCNMVCTCVYIYLVISKYMCRVH